MEASCRPSSSRTDINTARVEEIIQRDRRITVREIASELDLSYGNVQRIVADEVRYSKQPGETGKITESKDTGPACLIFLNMSLNAYGDTPKY
ncbi:histone-lysine N-methyltransferase SETMAR [Nephila pilipes]|uniref:Histone-lysine N-methyltransferase SETMAR n=1 Tax=Nephila pilipes TaxID=299642 RepID=A0A8X6INV3_NEPPI|nr:histone-lysine N-methyltransferase SETMAR [Nephila pilipes]